MKSNKSYSTLTRYQQGLEQNAHRWAGFERDAVTSRLTKIFRNAYVAFVGVLETHGRRTGAGLLGIPTARKVII